uniref:Uncharacterized protein n=1 Tax=Biomphalaria glabrata TaxID=6526 RepID=A0A2C9LPT1_BIOGL
MYYRKGTDQHLTFLRNMREAHAMYPFTGKRDKELFDKALAELYRRMPFLRHDSGNIEEHFYVNSYQKLRRRLARKKACIQGKLSSGYICRLYFPLVSF